MVFKNYCLILGTSSPWYWEDDLAGGDCAVTPNLFTFVIPIIRSLPPSPDKDPDSGIQLSDQVWGLTRLESDMMQIPHQARKPQLAFYRPSAAPSQFALFGRQSVLAAPNPLHSSACSLLRSHRQHWKINIDSAPAPIPHFDPLPLSIPHPHNPPSSPQNILHLFMGVCVCVRVCSHVCVNVGVGVCLLE